MTLPLRLLAILSSLHTAWLGSGALSFHAIFRNLSGVQSDGCECDLWLSCNNHAGLVTFANRDKNFAIIACNAIINGAKNASRSSVLGYKGIVGLQNKH